jgi:hypothetical protein
MILDHCPEPSYPISPRQRTNCVTESQAEPNPPTPGAPTRPTWQQRAVAFTFLGAFGLTILTVVLTGLWVRSPAARRAPEPVAVTLTVGEVRTIDLPFESQTAVENAELIVDLPAGIELRDRPGLRRVEWQTRLAAGNNQLPLELVARSGSGGQLAARLRYGDSYKTVVVDIVVSAR